MNRKINKHPNNHNVVSIQLDEHRASVFREMRMCANLSVTEALMSILYPVIDGAKQTAAARVFAGEKR